MDYLIRIMRDGVSAGEPVEVTGDLAMAEQMAKHILRDSSEGTGVIVYEKKWMSPEEQVASFWVPRVPDSGTYSEAG
jgi:hypothetical protein